MEAPRIICEVRTEYLCTEFLLGIPLWV